MIRKDILPFELKLSVQAKRNLYFTYLHTDTDNQELLSKYRPVAPGNSYNT